MDALMAPNGAAMRVRAGRPLMSDRDVAAYTAILSPDAAVRPPDVAYYLGTGRPEKWLPDSPSLGESERAVVHLSARRIERIQFIIRCPNAPTEPARLRPPNCGGWQLHQLLLEIFLVLKFQSIT